MGAAFAVVRLSAPAFLPCPLACCLLYITDSLPTVLLPQALFTREDQAGGKKKVGASMLTMFSSSIRLIGKMRVRLSTVTANTPMNVSMPLQGNPDGDPR